MVDHRHWGIYQREFPKEHEHRILVCSLFTVRLSDCAHVFFRQPLSILHAGKVHVTINTLPSTYLPLADL